MSSRIAACGHPPVSTALILPASKASCRVRNSPSSRVKMSLVTAQMSRLSLVKCLQSCSINAVLPVPTGPPMPTVKARSS